MSVYIVKSYALYLCVISFGHEPRAVWSHYQVNAARFMSRSRARAALGKEMRIVRLIPKKKRKP